VPCGEPDDDDAEDAQQYCTPNLTGNVAASAEIRDSFGVDSYTYEVDAQTRDFIVEPRTVDGDSLGTLRCNATKETLFELQGASKAQTGSDVVVTYVGPCGFGGGPARRRY
jgi:hypothetical protein